MNREIMKNIIFVILGGILLIIVELKLIQLNEILLLILGFIGFVAFIDGIFGLYHILKKEPLEEEV